MNGNNIHLCRSAVVHGLVLIVKRPPSLLSWIVGLLDGLNVLSLFGDTVRQLRDFLCTILCVWKSYDHICRDDSAQFTIRTIVVFLVVALEESNASRQMPSFAIIYRGKLKISL